MSETQVERTQQAAVAEPSAIPLDRVVAATERRQSIAAEAAACLGVAPDKVLNLLRNVWKTSKGKEPLTDQEMFVGLSMIARFELDPISREIYVTRTKNGLATIVGIDGWIKILDRTDHYDGFEQELVRDEKSGDVTCCVTTIFSKKHSHPARYEAFTEEYKRVSGFVAQAMPIHMLRIFSLRHAARLFTPLGGVTTKEEAESMGQVGEENAKPSLSEVIKATAEHAEEPVEPDPAVGLPAELTDDSIHDADPDAEQGDDLALRLLDYRDLYRETEDIDDPAERLGAIDALDAQVKKDPVVSGKPNQWTILGEGGFSAKARLR